MCACVPGLQHTATHCNTLQHTATLCVCTGVFSSGSESLFIGYKALLEKCITLKDFSTCVVVFVGLTFLTDLHIYSNTRVRMGMYTYVLIWGGYG